MAALTASTLAAPTTGQAGAPAPVPGAPVSPAYTLFRQNGYSYLLPAMAVGGVFSAEHLRGLTAPVAGWAGTLAMRGGALPVLDAAALFGQGGLGRVVVILRVAGGPLGLLVEQVQGRRPLGDLPLAPLAGAVGVLGGLVADDEVILALAPERFAALRAAAIGRDADGQSVPLSVTWTSGDERPDGVPPAAADAPRVGDPLLVLGSRAADDAGRYLAVPLRTVRAVARTGALRPGLPGAPAIVGYRAWGRLPVPAVNLGALGVAAPARGGTESPAQAGRGDYAVLAALANGGQAFGAALLTAGVRGVQRLERVDGDASPPLIAVSGETAAARVAVLSPAALAAAIGPTISSPGY